LLRGSLRCVDLSTACARVGWETPLRKMCELCSSDPEEKLRAKERQHRLADRLERMTSVHRGLADGTIKPHSEECKRANNTALLLIKELVEEWI
jgi:hypothetical protein